MIKRKILNAYREEQKQKNYSRLVKNCNTEIKRYYFRFAILTGTGASSPQIKVLAGTMGILPAISDSPIIMR